MIDSSIGGLAWHDRRVVDLKTTTGLGSRSEACGYRGGYSCPWSNFQNEIEIFKKLYRERGPGTL